MKVYISVLLVDDDIAFLLCLKQFLENSGLSIDIAQTFDNAMSLLNTNNYDAVIADIRLSGFFGEEGIEILRHVKRYKDGIRVIIVTAYGNPDLMKTALTLGADFYFEKPVPGNVLLTALGKCK